MVSAALPYNVAPFPLPPNTVCRVYLYYIKLFSTRVYGTAESRIFSSHPRRTHSGKKDKEKED
jgi:hypothetical protein